MTTLLTVDEVAAVLNVSPRFAYDLVARGDIVGMQLGPKCVRVHPDDLAAYQDHLRAAAIQRHPVVKIRHADALRLVSQ